jgi:DNA-binding LacI/PurR family transcriptional regulator
MIKENSLLYIQIKKQLIEAIKLLQPNDRLPARTELVKKYQVTRTTIDRAISELIGEGYLYSRDGSGTYVTGNEVSAIATDNTPNVISWGMILPDITRDTYPGILRGVEDVANKYNINVVICNADDQSEKQTNYINKLIDANVKGLIIVPALIGAADLLSFERLRAKDIPFVFCNRSVNGVEAPKVTSNSFYGGYIATKHLIQCGYRTIAYVSRPMYSVSLERYQGYMSALTEAGMELREELVIFEDSWSERASYESTREILTRRPRPDAIFAFNDIIAQNAYEGIAEAGLKIGADIGLVGYDDTNICERLPVKLSSVKFKTYEIGFKAAELLLSIMRGEDIPKNKTVILQPELVIRDSCKKINA